MDDKFFTIKNLQFNYYYKPIITDKNKDLVIVYCVWGCKEYVDFLYISLISQFKYTDINNFDIIIYYQKEVKEYISKIENIFTNIKFILVDNCLKYNITTFNEIKNYKYLVICDTDLFFYGRKTNFYDKILISQNLVSLIKEPNIAEDIFINRQILCPIKDLTEYKTKIAFLLGIKLTQLNQILKNNNWYLSCIAIFNTNIFTNEWKAHVNNFLKLNTSCDETVFLTYLWKKQYQINALNDIYLGENCNKYYNTNQFCLLHPACGNNRFNLECQILYKNILGGEN